MFNLKCTHVCWWCRSSNWRPYTICIPKGGWPRRCFRMASSAALCRPLEGQPGARRPDLGTMSSDTSAPPFAYSTHTPAKSCWKRPDLLSKRCSLAGETFADAILQLLRNQHSLFQQFIFKLCGHSLLGWSEANELPLDDMVGKSA